MQGLIQGLLNDVPVISEKYGNLFDSAIPKIPIPFFGDIANAKVITIGANPSDTEIRDNGWTASMNADEIVSKLKNYFNDNSHKWFEGWENPLSKIGVSYKNGTAAHIDLSPWASKSISALKDTNEQNQFLDLVMDYISYFWKFLEKCKNVKLCLIAGTITKKYWINDFIHKKAESEKYNIIGDFCHTKGEKGKGHYNYNTIILGERKINAWFCSSSPSGRIKTDILPKRMEECKCELSKMLN